MLRCLAEEAPPPGPPACAQPPPGDIKQKPNQNAEVNDHQRKRSADSYILPPEAANHLKPQPATKVSKLIHSERPPTPPTTPRLLHRRRFTFVWVATFRAEASRSGTCSGRPADFKISLSSSLDSPESTHFYDYAMGLRWFRR